MWPQAVHLVTRAAAAFLREALDAWRVGRPFSDTRTFSVRLPAPRVAGVAQVRRAGDTVVVPTIYEQKQRLEAPGLGAATVAVVTVSITVPFVRIVLDGESYGMDVTEAAALAGVNPSLGGAPKPAPEVRDGFGGVGLDRYGRMVPLSLPQER